MKLDYMIELEGGFRIHGSEELRSYYDAAMTEQYQSFEVEWPEGDSTTVYVKSGDAE